MTGANRHDVSQLKAVLGNRVVKPAVTGKAERLCADAGYAGKAPCEVMIQAGYEPHVRSHGEERQEKSKNSGYRARRWVVDLSLDKIMLQDVLSKKL